jgi:hypothetical protein
VLHVYRVHVLLNVYDPDRRAAKAARPTVGNLCRQLEAGVPHGALPAIVRPIAPVLLEVLFGAVRQKNALGSLERRARGLKAIRDPVGAFTGMAAGIEAAGPLLLRRVRRVADALGDHADLNVTVKDQPSLLRCLGITAASQLGLRHK